MAIRPITILSVLILVFISILVYDYSLTDFDPPSYLVATFSNLYLWGQQFPKNDTLSVQRWRRALSNRPPMNFLDSSKAVSYTSIGITVDEHLTIPGRLYLPSKMDKDTTDKHPVILWFFGGGFTLGSLEADEQNCYNIAESTGSIVVSVSYRQAPEHMYPAAVYDAVHALKWVNENIVSYGGDRRRIVVGGESAGGNLATVVAALNFDENSTSGLDGIPAGLNVNLIGVVLVYPVLDRDFTRKSYFTYSRTNGILTKQQMTWFWRLYAGLEWYWDSKVGCSFTACPIRVPGSILSKFPPTQILLAKFDVLYDEGDEFGRRLRRLGVQTNVTVFKESVHGFFSFSGAASQIRAMKLVSDFVTSRNKAPLQKHATEESVGHEAVLAHAGAATVAVQSDGQAQVLT